ncbi:HET-domain-containing protein [Pseudovirgaria hyperparasitica]|uniref:HET-domain-containing protein n=1 Tax=Pseudovirgaria hyperparasitica TaxID=470096 RepID=A0A6A6VSV5_9PEZI|nr:HET-domain-containing protein [Pseudovirgaria hyperparasitica]KAF2752866.1 HET-domain-containing protein [Pseudovirgaria hyperparasitica]
MVSANGEQHPRCKACGLEIFRYSDHAPLYEDTALEVSALRLVQLHPARQLDADIVIEIFARKDTLEKEDTHRKYEALSWSWGGQHAKKHVRVRHQYEDLCFMVTENLDSALRNLRHVSVYRWLWVDYLCINQSDMREKNVQVPMMAGIYAQAVNACIWLGESDEKSKLAIKFIKESVLDLRKFDKLCKDEALITEWDALISLMRRPWFHRRWVVQEIALSDYNKAIIQCGEDFLCWRDFADAVSLFNEVETGTHSLSRLMKAAKEFGNIPNFFGHVPELGATKLVEATNNIFRVRSGLSSEEERQPLLSLEHLVSILSVFEASEPRDSIYALLAIAKDTSPGAEAMLELVGEEAAKRAKWTKNRLRLRARRKYKRQCYEVDYETTLNKVYQDFIIFCTRNADQRRALDMLCRPWAPVPRKDHEGKEIDVFPSWVSTLENAPFKLAERDGLGMRTWRRYADPLVGIPGKQSYNAAGSTSLGSKFDFVVGTDFHNMKVEGFVLGRLAQVEQSSQLGQIPPEWPKMGGWLKRDQLPPDAFWRTLVGDRGPDGRNALPFYPRACVHAFRNSADDTLNTESLIHYGPKIVGEFLRRVQAVIWNRRLVKTDKGHLGLAPKAAQPGDLVCILYGCSVPVILRPVKKGSTRHEKEVREFEAVRWMKKIRAVLSVFWVLYFACKEKNRPAPRIKEMLNKLEEKYTAATEEAERVLSLGGGKPQREQGVANGINGQDTGKPTSSITNGSKPNGPAQPRPQHSIQGSGQMPKTHRKVDLHRDKHSKKESVHDYGGVLHLDQERPHWMYMKWIGECYVHGQMNGEAVEAKAVHNRVERERLKTERLKREKGEEPQGGHSVNGSDSNSMSRAWHRSTFSAHRPCRTIQTALISFQAAADGGLKIIALPDVQEATADPSDTGVPILDLRE